MLIDLKKHDFKGINRNIRIIIEKNGIIQIKATIKNFGDFGWFHNKSF